MNDQFENAPPKQGAARLALLLALAWLAAGAFFKLLAGNPNDLPETIRNFPILKPNWTFRFAIGTELVVCALVLLRPRKAWALIVLLFGFFDFLLYKMGAAGETKCGCFGGSTPDWLTPFWMMAIDSVLLLGVLITRPWSRFGPEKPTLLPQPLLYVLLVSGLILLPWHPDILRVTAVNVTTDEETGKSTVELETPVEEIDFHHFEPTTWEGQVFDQLDLMGFLHGVDDPWSAFPIGMPTNVILYRDSCDHCREHFEGLLAEPLSEETQLVLIKIPEQGDATNVVDDVKPQNFFADLSLVPLGDGYGITTPVIFDITGDTFEVANVIQGGEEGEDE